MRDLEAMRKQARAILCEQGKAQTLLDSCFKVTSVVVFVGHRIDRPNRLTKRFPPEKEGDVRAKIAKALDEMNAGIAYSSAACGSDIIFLEEMQKRGAELNIVLPFDIDHFCEDVVDIEASGNWKARFDKLIKKAAQVKVLGHYRPMPTYDIVNLYVYGSALLRADMLNTEIKPMAVWDGRIQSESWGTATTVNHWKKQGQPFTHIQLDSESENIPTHDSTPRKKTKKFSQTASTISYHQYFPMLFADVKGYSQFTEKQIIDFAVNFLDPVSEIINNFGKKILSKKTIGDGLFFVFEDISTAAEVATDLRDKIKEIDWTAYGLPENLQLRISLDAGPCYSYTDQVTKNIDFCGHSVIRASRLEPVTPPEHIYATETFVALARATGVKKFRFNYAGQVILPKHFGTIRAFHVQAENNSGEF